MTYDEPGELFDRWRQGRTGYPIVDAGMRQLRATGWMHNRVRMIVASFLVKDLHVEWQHGARHFMQWLVDGDLASNQHGWQWTAGCGTDAAPCFRVFNPITQGKKFDPDGTYVRQWVPELADADGPARPGRPDRRPRRGAPRGARPLGEDPPMTDLLVPARFRGPASSGNGGWTAGALAELLDHDVPADHAARWPTVQVTLRRPPPLDTPLPVVDGTASDPSGEVVASAEVVERDLTAVEAVDLATATTAAASYAGLRSHPFPTCFACGTGREEGDGLRIFPGRVDDDGDGRARVAAPWTPHPTQAEDWHEYTDDHRRASLAVTWAALDCVGGWAGDLEERLMVLGRMTARVDALPEVGEPHVVVGGARGSEGRKTFTASTLYDAGGRVVAVAEHTWFAVDPAAFNG